MHWKEDLESLLREAQNESDQESVEQLKYLIDTVDWKTIDVDDAQNMVVAYKRNDWLEAKRIADKNSRILSE